jgi:hypothetical protein
MNPPTNGLQCADHPWRPVHNLVVYVLWQVYHSSVAVDKRGVRKLGIPFGVSRAVRDTPRADTLDLCRAIHRPFIHEAACKTTAFAEVVGVFYGS